MPRCATTGRDHFYRTEFTAGCGIYRGENHAGLFELIHREHPGVTAPVVIAELKRQAAADQQEADALDAYRPPANDRR